MKNATILAKPENLPDLCNTWFYKPHAISRSPFDKTIFCDLDCEVRGKLSRMFVWSDHGLVLGNDLYPLSNSRKLFRENCYYNTGLIGVGRDNVVIRKWCEETKKLHETLRSDQEILNLVIYQSEATVVELPKHFHQLRLDGDHDKAVVMHWTGNSGKTYIRRAINKMKIKTIQ